MQWGVPGGSETSLGDYTAEFYGRAAAAVKAVDAGLRVGGPSGANPVVLAAFLEQVKALALPLDFVSYHQYGNARECGSGWKSSYSSGLPPGGHGGNSAGYSWDPTCFRELFSWARAQVPEELPLYITEYSVSVGEIQVDHDTSSAAAFVFRMIGDLDGVVDVLSFWAFSDIFEEQGLPGKEFSGFYGLETYHGISKPVRRAFEMLHRHAGPRRVQVATTTKKMTDSKARGHGGGGGCVVTKDLGCFNQQLGSDGSCFNQSDQSALGYGNASLTSCLDYCYTHGAAEDDGASPVKYVGMESGYQCWCSVRPLGNSTACPPTPVAECDSPCHNGLHWTTNLGNATCGGSWRLRAYQVDCDPALPLSDKWRRTPADLVAAFATTTTTVQLAVARAATAARSNISVFLSSWDASQPPQGSPTAAAAGVQSPVTVQVVLSPHSAMRLEVAQITRVDEGHANPRVAWLAMGSPPVPSTAQLQQLDLASAVNTEALAVQGGQRQVNVEIPPNACYVLQLQVYEH